MALEEYIFYQISQLDIMEAVQLTIKDFEVVKQLGSGSFGQVQLVRKKDTQQLYALKSVSLSKLNQKQKDNALNQVRLLASIHIPTVIGYEGAFFNMDTQSLCVVLQYADGGDLQGMITDRSNTHPDQGFEQKAIWKIAWEILSGLKTLHKNKIIHRDIKSANIFFANGIAKLGDLNVSKLTENGMCSTQTGTPYYTAPQIWKGQNYGNKCDIWSSGCLFYELCTLTHPFKARDFPGLYRKVCSGIYADIPSKYSQKMKSLIRMCLTVDEEMRASASQLLQSSLFHQFEKNIAQDEQEGEVNMVDTIKCPKVLRFLNSRLPKPTRQDLQKKKTVCFASKKEIDSSVSKGRQLSKQRKIRSQKIIQWVQSDQPVKIPKIPSSNKIKLPPVQKEQVSQKNIGSGLTFSTKKLKSKPTSTKCIPEQPQPGKQNKKLLL